VAAGDRVDGGGDVEQGGTGNRGGDARGESLLGGGDQA